MAEQKTHWKKQHNYSYLGAYSFSDYTKDAVLTIKSLLQEDVAQMNGKKDKCLVCHFAEPGVKPMILNKTNCKIIEKLLGTPFIEEWIGKKIAIYVTQVNAFGVTTDALRVRDTLPKGK